MKKNISGGARQAMWSLDSAVSSLLALISREYAQLVQRTTGLYTEGAQRTLDVHVHPCVYVLMNYVLLDDSCQMLSMSLRPLHCQTPTPWGHPLPNSSGQLSWFLLQGKSVLVLHLCNRLEWNSWATHAVATIWTLYPLLLAATNGWTTPSSTFAAFKQCRDTFIDWVNVLLTVPIKISLSWKSSN